jgi:AcrR family transcriptional regulator
MTASERPARGRYHHGDLRTAMIAATEAMVRELGPESVSVRAVARRAGVSSGAPFHHFPTRRALMTAVAEEATHRLRQRMEAATNGIPEADTLARLRAMGRAYLGWVVDNPAQFQVVSDRRLIDYSAAIATDNSAIQTLMREALAKTLKPGGEDIDAAMLGVRAMAYGLARMLVDGHLPQWGVTELQPLPRLEATLDGWLEGLTNST